MLHLTRDKTKIYLWTVFLRRDHFYGTARIGYDTLHYPRQHDHHQHQPTDAAALLNISLPFFFPGATQPWSFSFFFAVVAFLIVFLGAARFRAVKSAVYE